MMRALSVLAARWRRHTCTPLTDAISGDVRCWCGHRPEYVTTLRRALASEAERVSKNGAPGWNPGTPPITTAVKEPTMTTIITRHARDLHAGDVITHDPDHDRPVRWRVSRPPVITGDGEYAVADYTDLDVDRHGILYFRVLASLSVEPVGGAS